MFETIIFLLFLFVFFYAKNRTDQLRDEVAVLKARIGGSNAITAESGQPQISDDANKVDIDIDRVILQTPRTAQIAESAWVNVEPAAPAEKEKSDDGDLEFKVGGKMFTAVGVVAVIFAIGFFLRYAFENDLINEYARVAMGVFAGLILLGAGEFTRKRFPGYGQMLTGGGLGVLYLSFYAAFSFYGLIAQPAAFFMMILVTAAGIALSLRQNSMALAMFSQVGGFLTPLLIDSGSGNPHVLFLYVALLVLAVFLLAFYKLWPPLSLVSFAGTAITFLYWHSHFYDSVQFTAAQGYLSLFFVIFLCIPFIQYFIKKSPENSWDLSLVVANPFFYFAMSYAIIDPVYPDLMGWFTIVLGALYCSLAAAVGGENNRASLFRHFLMTAGFILLAIAVPIQFDGRWIAVAWTAEALAFIATGFRLKFTIYRVLGNFLMFLTLMRILIFDSGLPSATPLFNVRLLTYMMFMAAAAAAAYVYRKKKNEIGEDERPLFSLLALEAAFAGLVGPTLEINDFPKYFGSQWYPVFWTAGGLAAGLLSFRLRGVTLRCVTYLTFAVSFFRLIFFESVLTLARGAQYIPIFNKRVFGFLASAAIIRYFLALLRKNKDRVFAEEFKLFQPVLFIAFHLLMLWVVSAEIVTWCDRQAIDAVRGSGIDYDNLKNVLLSVAWTLYSVILLVIGIVKKATYERFAALSLFTLVIIKVFLIDTADLGDLYRFFSFVTLGGILLLAGYLYYRYRDRIQKFVKGE